MIPYIILCFVPLLFSFVSFGNKKEARLIIGSNEYTQSRNISLIIFFLMVSLLLALRHETVGNDTGNYRIYFEYYRVQSLSSFFSFSPEVLFYTLNWLIGKFTDSFQVYLTIVAVVTLLPIALLYIEDREHSYLKIVLFLNMSTFIVLFSGIRQMLAVAVVVAYIFVRKKKILLFLVAVLIAVGFHHSGFILIVLYPLYHIKFTSKHLFFLIPAFVLVLLFNKQIFLYLAKLYASYSEGVGDITTSSTGAITMLLVFVLFIVFCYIIPDEEKMDKELFGLRNMLVFCTFIQSFASVHALAMRMNYYFIVFVPIIMAKVLKVAKPRYKEVAKFAEIVICVFFTVYFLFGIWRAYKTGEGALNTVPYVPFWETA